MRTTHEFTRGYAAGRAKERESYEIRNKDAELALSMVMRLAAEIESSSQEKIVGLTKAEREIVDFYRARAAEIERSGKGGEA